jgi:CCR4-NOT transcription complex subunit 2
MFFFDILTVLFAVPFHSIPFHFTFHSISQHRLP